MRDSGQDAEPCIVARRRRFIEPGLRGPSDDPVEHVGDFPGLRMLTPLPRGLAHADVKRPPYIGRRPRTPPRSTVNPGEKRPAN